MSRSVCIGILAAVFMATTILPQADVDQKEPPPTSHYGWVPIAKIDGPLEFSLAASGRRLGITLALDPRQRSNLDISTSRTDTSLCLNFRPTYDRVRPPHLGFDIEGEQMLLMFVYAGDTAAYRLRRQADTTGIAVVTVSIERTASFIRYTPPQTVPDRPERREK
jgi:hypothetical protein